MPLLLLLLLLVVPAAQAEDNIPLSVRRVILQTQQLMSKHLYADALKLLDKHVHQSKHHYLVDFTVGNIYLLTDRREQAIPHYKMAVKKQPHHAGSWINLAQCYYAIERYPLAAQAFQHGYSSHKPPDAKLLYNAALCYLQGGEANLALPLLLQLLHDFPASVAIGWRGALVQVYLQLDRPYLAMEQLKILTKQTMADEQRRWRELLVQQYLVLKMADDALAAVEHYLGDDGLEPRWWQLLTYLQLESGHYPEALVAIKVLAYLRELSDDEMKLLADLHLNLGVPAQALRYYQQLQQHSPLDKYLLMRLAYANLNLHQPQQALAWTQRADKIDVALLNDGDRVSLLRLQAQLLFDLGRYTEAVTVFGRLAKMVKEPGRVWLMQGYAAWNAQMWQQARLAFKRAERYPAQRKRAGKLLRQMERVQAVTAKP